MASPDQFMPPGAFNAGSLAAFAATTEDDFRGALSLQFTPPLAVLHNGFHNALELLEQIPGLGPLIALAAENLQLLINSIANALGHTGGEPYTAGDIFTFLGDIPGALISGITTIEQNIIDAIANAMGHAGTGHTAANILTYLEAIPATAIANVLGAADLGADIQAVVDKISNALGHAGTGHTLANLLSYLGAIPGSVISGITTVEQAALDAIANALGHAGTGHTTSDIQTYLGAIPGSVISGITTIEQNALDAIANALGHAGTGHTTSDIQTYLTAIPGSVISGITTIEQNALDAIANALGHAGTGHTTSDIQTYLGSIPATAISNILGSANFGADVQAIVTNLTTVFGGVTTTLTGLNTTLGNTFGSSFPKVFPFTFGTSSSNTPGKFASLAQFQQLIDGIIGNGTQGNTVVAAIGAFHNWLAAVQAAISQAILDGLNAQNALTGIATALQNIPSTLVTDVLGGSSLGHDVQNIVDDVENAISGATSGATTVFNNLNTFLTGLFNGFTGSGATAASSTSIGTAATNAAANISGNATSIAATLTQLTSLVAGGGISSTVNFSGYANAADLSAAGFTESAVFGAGSIGITNGLMAWQTVGNTANNIQSAYFNTNTNTDYQVVTAVPSGINQINGGAAPSFSILGRVNGTTGTTYVQVAFAAASLNLFAVVTGSGTTLATSTHTVINGATYQLVCGTVGSTYEYKVLCNGVVLIDYTDAGHVSQVGSSFRGSGIRLNPVYFGGAWDLPPNFSSWGIADGAPGLPTPITGIWAGTTAAYAGLSSYSSATLYFTH